MNQALWIEAAGWTLLHSLWQVTAIAVLLALVRMTIRSASHRYVAAAVALFAVVLAAVVTVSVQRRARFFLVSGVRQEQQRSCAQTHAERVYSAQKRGQALPLTGVPRVRPQFVNGRAQVASPVRARSPGQPPCRLHNLIIVHDCIKSSTRDAVIAADGPHQVPAALPGR